MNVIHGWFSWFTHIILCTSLTQLIRDLCLGAICCLIERAVPQLAALKCHNPLLFSPTKGCAESHVEIIAIKTQRTAPKLPNPLKYCPLTSRFLDPVTYCTERRAEQRTWEGIARRVSPELKETSQSHLFALRGHTGLLGNSVSISGQKVQWLLYCVSIVYKGQYWLRHWSCHTPTYNLKGMS